MYMKVLIKTLHMKSWFNIEGLLKLSYTNVYESFNKPPSPYTDDDHRSYCYCWAICHTLSVCMKHHGLTIASRISRARHPQQAILIKSSGILIPVISIITTSFKKII